MDAFGEKTIGQGMFLSYGSWTYVLFFATFLVSFAGMVFTVLGYCFTGKQQAGVKPKERNTLEMVEF